MNFFWRDGNNFPIPSVGMWTIYYLETKVNISWRSLKTQPIFQVYCSSFCVKCSKNKGWFFHAFIHSNYQSGPHYFLHSYQIGFSLYMKKWRDLHHHKKFFQYFRGKFQFNWLKIFIHFSLSMKFQGTKNFLLNNEKH